MTLVCLATSGGREHVVTLAEFGWRLHDPGTTGDILTALVQEGRADVMLRGGLRATVTYANPIPPSGQAVLPLPRPHQWSGPLRDYDVSARLSFELPASIRCSARSAGEAATLAGEVLSAGRRAPPGFTVGISGGDLEAFITGLGSASGGRLPRGHGVQRVLVTGVHERLLIGSNTP